MEFSGTRSADYKGLPVGWLNSEHPDCLTVGLVTEDAVQRIKRLEGVLGAEGSVSVSLHCHWHICTSVTCIKYLDT